MYLGQVKPNQTASLQAIPDGKAGTLATLKIMRQIARQYKTSLAVRNLALFLTQNLKSKDWFSEAKVIQEYARDKIRYVKDIAGVETLQTPEVTLEVKAGDCDDKSVLIASLLLSIGHPVRFVAIGKTPDNFVHVFPETRIGTKWVALEATEPVNIGWQPTGYPARLIVNV